VRVAGSTYEKMNDLANAIFFFERNTASQSASLNESNMGACLHAPSLLKLSQMYHKSARQSEQNGNFAAAVEVTRAVLCLHSSAY